MTELKESIKKYLIKTHETQDLMFYITHSMRITTLYWYVAIARLIDYEIPNKKEIIDFVLKCKNIDHFFGANINYPSTLVSTLNALQIFHILGHKYNGTHILNNIHKYVNKDGSVSNDKYKETDTRFTCCLTMIIALLQGLDINDNCRIQMAEEYVPVKLIIQHIARCQNEDGGFGASINAESHAANTYCCLASLKLLNCTNFDPTSTVEFLVFKQNSDGGLCGRINKSSDSCYGFWTFASLILVDADTYIDRNKLYKYTMGCFDDGAFSDRQGNEKDLYHTLYALLTLNFLGKEGIRKGYALFGF